MEGGPAVEVPLSPWWRRRIAGAFSFPGMTRLMATLALAAAGAAVGSALLPAGISVLGATITGATIGSQIGALAGSFVDQALFAPSGQTRTFRGPAPVRPARHRLDRRRADPAPLRPLPARRPGDLGDRLRGGGRHHDAASRRRRQGASARRLGGGGAAQQIEYRYYANFAVALAEGPITGIGRVWADGRELDLSGIT